MMRQRMLFSAMLAALILGLGCGKKPDPGQQQAKPPDGDAPPAASGKVPAALAFLPGDALGFASVKVSDLWDSASGKEARKLLAFAPNELERMEDEVGLKPADIEYAGFVVQIVKQEPTMFVVAKQKLDRQKLADRFVPDAKPVKHAGKEILAGSIFKRVGQAIGKTSNDPPKVIEEPVSDHDPALYFVNDNTFVKGSLGQLKKFVEQQPGAGSLSSALAQAGDHHVVACLDMAATVKQAGKPPTIPAEFEPLFKADMYTVTADIGKPWKINVQGKFPDEAAAQAGQKAADSGLNMLKAQILLVKQMTAAPSMAMFAGSLDQVDQGLKQAALKQTGKNVALALDLPIEIKIDEKVLGSVRQAADRTVSANNIKQILLAVHNSHDVYGKFPPQAVCDKDGKPLLSWRVTLLPFLEDNALYEQFKFDEPWDGPNNKKLLDKMPKIFAMPGVKAQPGMTYYRSFSGPGTLFPGKGKVEKYGKGFGLFGVRGFGDVTDGLSNTIYIVEAGEPVPWTKPEEIQLDAKQLPALGPVTPGQFWAGMLDGSVRKLDLKQVSEKTLRNAINPSDNEPLGKDFP